MRTFVAELRRRNVLRVAAAYALVAWIIIEAGSVLLPTFGASDTTFQVYVIAVLLGFFVSLVFAWIFEITPEGVRVDSPDTPRDTPKQPPKALTNYLIIGLLVVALGISVTFNVTGLRDVGGRGATAAMQDRRAIAVLPFTSRSTVPENALFADGIHDDLLTRLANLGAFKVISRTSVMEYRDTTKNLRQIADELGVDTLLEGAVQRVGDDVRINVQLIDAETDEHLWASSYDRNLAAEGLFAVQSDVATAISSALHSTLMPDEAAEVVSIPTDNLRAYSLYMSGRDKLNLRRLEPLLEARAQLEEALSLDAEYAEAHVALAEAVLLQWINHVALPRDEAWRIAETHIDRALELNPDLAGAYATLGLLRTNQWAATRMGTQNVEAEAAFEQAIALNPNHAAAYMWFAGLRDAEQRIDDAIAYYHRSMQLDPLGRVPYSNLPALYAQLGQYEIALKLWLEAIDIHPDWPTPYQNIALHLAGMGRLDEALAWGRTAQALSSEAEFLGNISIGIYVRFGEMERARTVFADFSDTHMLAPLRPGFERLLDGDFEAALAFFTGYIERDPEQTAFLLGFVADVATLTGELDRARQFAYMRHPILAADTAEIPVDRFTLQDVVRLGYILKREGNTQRGNRLLDSALPVAQSMPRLGMFGHGVRDVQILALLGRRDEAIAALRGAIDAGFRSNVLQDFWPLRDDPYLASLREDARFVAMLDELDDAVAVMRERALEAEANDDWTSLTALTQYSDATSRN